MAEPRAIQVGRLLRGLNLPTALVCADYEHDAVRQDAQLLKEGEAFLEVCVRAPFAVTGWRRIPNGLASRVSLPIWNKTPDYLSPWRHAALRAIARLISERSFIPNVLTTFAQPFTDHIIGLKLKERYGWPWVAHFSDPWVDNPYTKHDSLTKAINRALERKVVLSADRLVFTSEETVALVMAKYPGEVLSKVRVVPHAFDPKLFPDTDVKRTDSPITIRYLGDLYKRRSPKPLFEALKRLSLSDPNSLKGLRFEIVGAIYDISAADLSLEGLPEDLVVVRQATTYLESLTLMREANGLLVIDAPAAKSVFLPSKLIEYMGAGRPILGITPEGTAAALIREVGGWVADPGNSEEIAKAIVSFVRFLRQNANKQVVGWGNDQVRNRFEVTAVAHQFAGVLSELSPASIRPGFKTV